MVRKPTASSQTALDRAAPTPSRVESLPQAPKVSKREANKADKLQRIKEASVALFLTKGYDDATTREIARIAGVALGTVFVYAKNKRDLLFLIFNDDLEAALVSAEAEVKPRAKLVDNLSSIAAFHFNYYARRPQLSRYALREMYFYEEGAQAIRFQDIRQRLSALFRRVVAWHAGEKSELDSSLVGDMVFAMFQFEVRKLLMTQKVDVNKSVESFRRQIMLLEQGLERR